MIHLAAWIASFLFLAIVAIAAVRGAYWLLCELLLLGRAEWDELKIDMASIPLWRRLLVPALAIAGSIGGTVFITKALSLIFGFE
jgi:hypothetical protein